RYMFLGSSMTKDRHVAIRTSAGSNSLRPRACRRCILKAWASEADLWGAFGSIFRVMDPILGRTKDWLGVRVVGRPAPRGKAGRALAVGSGESPPSKGGPRP